jgi:hypothetical protein
LAVICAAALLLVLAATLLLAAALLLATTLGWGHRYERPRHDAGTDDNRRADDNRRWTGGQTARVIRRWHYRGGRRWILGGNARGGGVAIAQHPKTEVVQPVGVAVIDHCERLSITGGGTRQRAIAVHPPIREDRHGIGFCQSSAGPDRRGFDMS